ncbi:Ribosomal protein S4/S9 [Phytophthora cactorum]|nr:Ribosomal protein S4/S9 [Phytophthora cactorum]
MGRQLKFHEQKLLKKKENNLHEIKVIRRYRIPDREQYHKYNRLKRPANDPYRVKTTTALLDKLYNMGLIQTKKSLLKAEEVNHQGSHNFRGAGTRPCGPTVVTDPAFLVTRPMEDFVTWVDSSKIKRTIMKYNDKLDDYDLLGN